MPPLKILSALFLTAALAGCATAPPPVQTPQAGAASAPHALARSELLQQTNHMTRHLNADKSIVYFQNFGGGGVGLGLLLGPFGVAANIAMIEKATETEAKQLFDKIALDPVSLFKQAATAGKLALRERVGDGDGGPRVAPYLYVARADEQNLQIAVAFLVEQGQGQGKWTGKYMYQLPRSYTLESLAQLDAAGLAGLRAEAEQGFRALAEFYAHDSQEAVQREAKVLFKSNFLNPRFDFELQGNLAQEQADRVWLRVVGGVFCLRKDGVQQLRKQQG